MGYFPLGFLTFYLFLISCIHDAQPDQGTLCDSVNSLFGYVNTNLIYDDLNTDGWTNIHADRTNLDGLYRVAVCGGGGGCGCGSTCLAHRRHSLLTLIFRSDMRHTWTWASHCLFVNLSLMIWSSRHSRTLRFTSLAQNLQFKASTIPKNTFSFPVKEINHNAVPEIHLDIYYSTEKTFFHMSVTKD